MNLPRSTSTPTVLRCLTVGLALVGCAPPPEPHRGPIGIAEALADPGALDLAPEIVESFALHSDPERRFARIRLELRDELLRVGDRIDVLRSPTSNEVVLWSLLVVGHDPERRWATLMLDEERARLVVALPSPLSARVNDPHATPEDAVCCPEPTDSDVIPREARRRRDAERSQR